MKKKLIIFLSIAFFVFIVTLYFYRQKQKKIETYIKQVEQVTTDIEQNELKDLQIEEPVKDLTGDEEKEKLLEKMIANQLADINIVSNLDIKSNEKKYQKLYLQEMKKDNLYLAIKAVKRILKTTKHKEIWYKKIINLYVKIGDFDLAEEYSKKLLEIEGTKENLHNYLYIKFQNINFFDENQVSEVKNLVSLLYKKKVIDSSELSFYNFLIQLLTDWKTDNLNVLLDDLVKIVKNPEQKNLIISIKNDLQVYKQKKGSPLYYFKALVALDLLKFGYFGLAKNIAERVYIEDSHYILPQQILAYSYFFMGNYENAIKYLKKLKDTDKSNDKEYVFYMGVSYYWLKNYENTLLFLSQIDDKYPYYEDVLRYSYLSYLKLDDYEKAVDILKKLSKYKLTYVDYYNIFKFLLKDCFNCYKKDTKLIVGLIENCYNDVDKKYEYVCWYGKANLYYKAGKINYSVKYFRLLTKYFQDPYIFDIIGNYYNKKGDKKRARYYYLKELLYTSNDKKREVIKNKIKKLYIDKN